MADVQTPDAVQAFLFDGQWLEVVSSNIRRARYDVIAGNLVVEYKDGHQGTYSPVGLEEAQDFAEAPSKMGWMWDHVLVRGKGNRGKHQKVYTRSTLPAAWR